MTTDELHDEMNFQLCCVHRRLGHQVHHGTVLSHSLQIDGVRWTLIGQPVPVIDGVHDPPATTPATSRTVKHDRPPPAVDDPPPVPDPAEDEPAEEPAPETLRRLAILQVLQAAAGRVLPTTKLEAELDRHGGDYSTATVKRAAAWLVRVGLVHNNGKGYWVDC